MKKLPFLLLLMSVAALSIPGNQVTPPDPISAKVTLREIRDQLKRKKPTSRSKRPFFSADLDAKLVRLSSSEKSKLFIEQAQLYRKAGIEGGFDRNIRRALDDSEDSAESLVMVSKYLTDLGAPRYCKHAVAANTSYLEIHPDSDSAYGSRAKAKVCISDLLGAFDDLTKALKIKPDDSHYLIDRLNTPYRMADTSKALELFQIVIDDNKRAAAKFPSGNLAITYKSLLASSFISRSFLYKKIGDKDKQLADLTSAVETWPDPNLQTRAFQYWEYKMFDLAIADMSEYIRLQEKRYGPRYQKAVWNLYVARARLYVDAGRTAEAINDYQKAIELSPENKKRLEDQISRLKPDR